MTTSDAAPLPPLNLHEYETAARALLAPMAFEFVAGGSGDEVTLRGNRAAFDRWRLLPRVLRGVRDVSTATSVLGQVIALPVLIAPSSLHRLCHDHGERATARAAKAAGTIYTLSTPASIAIEEVAPEAGPWWFQLYVYRDRGLTRELVARGVRRGLSPRRLRRYANDRAAGGGRTQSLYPSTRGHDAPYSAPGTTTPDRGRRQCGMDHRSS